jgi:6-phosphofructokinase 2
MTLALARGRKVEDALMYAIAAGAATALNPGTKLCRREDVERFYEGLVSREGAPEAEAV